MTQRSDPSLEREDSEPGEIAGASNSTSRRATLVRVVLLAALTWLVYSNSLHGPFVFDDWHVIPQNPAVRGPADIPSFFTDVSTFSILTGNRGYRPVFLTSMALSWWVGDGATLPFHLVSVALHTGSVIILFFLVRLILSSRRAGAVGAEHSSAEWTAWVAAALFAVHPLATESIDYISSQSVPLAAFFYLVSFLLFLWVQGRRERAESPNSWMLQIGSLVSYLLALLSKPIAITLPLNLILWDLLLGGEAPSPRRIRGPTWKQHASRLRKHVPYVAVTILYLLIRRVAEPGGIGREAPRELYAHYLTQTKALVFYYLQLALFPVNQNADVEYAVSSSLLEWPVLAAFAVLTAIAWLAFRLRRHRALLFWCAWFPSCLLVTTYLTVLGQVVNEHRVYLSLAGACVVAAMLLARLRSSLLGNCDGLRVGARARRMLAAGLALSILAALGLATRERNRIWSSPLTLWQDAALHGGTYRAHMNFGLGLEAAGRADEALAQFEEAVELGPYAFPHINLGLALVKREQIERGLVHMRHAVSLWPTLPEAHLWLSYGLEANGELDAAESELLRSLELRPNYLKAYRRLWHLHEKKGEREKALAAYRQLQELDSSARHPDPHFELAWSEQKLGNRRDAIRLYEELLEISPNHRQGNFNLAYAYLKSESPDALSRSAALFARVLEIDPSYDESIHHRATGLWKLGREQEALEQDRRYVERGTNRELKSLSHQRIAASKQAQRDARSRPLE